MGRLAYITDDGRIIPLGRDDLVRVQREVRLAASAIARHEKKDNPGSDYKILYDKIGRDSFWTPARLKDFCNGRGGNKALANVDRLIDQVTSGIHAPETEEELKRVAPSLMAPSIAVSGSQTRRIAIEFGKELEDQIGFVTEYKGTYLIIRKHRSNEFALSLMRVGGSYYGDIAQFQTIRRFGKDHSLRREIKGVIYRSKGMVYSIGRVDGQGDLRLSIMHRHINGSLFGIRLGLYPDENRPFATKILVIRLKKDPGSTSDLVRHMRQFTGVYTQPDAARILREFSAKNLMIGDFAFEDIVRLVGNERHADFSI